MGISALTTLKALIVAQSRRVTVLSTAVIGSLVLAACSNPGDGTDASPVAEFSEVSSAAATTSEAPAVAPSVSVKNGSKNVALDTRVKVESEGEGLASVTMTNQDGKRIKSKMSADSMSWTSDEDLGFNRTYTGTAKDVNDKTPTTMFSTPSPTYTSSVAMSPLPDSTVGVGQTIALRFEGAVTNRRAVQDAITIETTPHVEGAFYWISNQEVRWRPENKWEPGTQVSVKADLYGLDLGNGMYATEDNSTNFTIGDRVVAIVDNNTKQMQVFKNRELLRTIPVSLGLETPDRVTPNGWYIVGDKYPELMMDSTTYGLALDAGGYRTMVDWATQLSYSGIYVHSAPWSVWAQGNTNTSHGCINVSPEAAQWFQNTVKRGDLVYVKNTPGGMLPVTDGEGDWNMSWEEWSAGNADV